MFFDSKLTSQSHTSQKLNAILRITPYMDFNLKKDFLKKLYGPLLWMEFNYLKARATLRRQFTLYHKVPRNSWYLFYHPRKDEGLSQLWSHPVALNTRPLDWEFSALTTRPLLHQAVNALDALEANAFFMARLNYCPLIWMCHNRTYNNKINRLHEICLRFIYNDKCSSFEDL